VRFIGKKYAESKRCDTVALFTKIAEPGGREGLDAFRGVAIGEGRGA